MPALSVAEYEALASERMEPGAFDYFAGGSGDELTLADNIDAFRRVRLKPRALRGVVEADTAVTLFGHRLALPMLLAPTAFNRLAHPDGEVAAARAAAAEGTVLCCSTMATCAIEDVAAVPGVSLWFQVYVFRDREVTADLVARAQAAGVRAVVLTVDTGRLGRRERDLRNRFGLPEGLVAANLAPYAKLVAERTGRKLSLSEYAHTLLDASLTWAAVEWLAGLARVPVLVKGVLTADDARAALDHGAAGVIVSNHGGRQLDGAVASLDALPEIAAAVRDRVPVLVDGGIRRGVDILKAVALGAHATLAGRAYLWGLAADGERGVRDVIALLRAELELAMALSGCADVASINRSLIV
jgi:4-hydroxymandelate oxidase